MRLFLIASRSLLLGIIYSVGVDAQIQFEEATTDAGISYVGASWGVAWGDFNGDGLPDAWASNHGNRPSLHLNQGGGRFIDIVSQVWSGPPNADTHGAAWADFDNDGDQDLIHLVGAASGTGAGPNQLFINNAGMLVDSAIDYGIDYPMGRGRTPLWLDWNADGKLDVFLANFERPNGEAPSALFTQEVDRFTNDNESVGIVTQGNNTFAQFSGFTDQFLPTLLIHGSPYPNRSYSLDSTPFQDIADELGFAAINSRFGVRDAAIADFNGDLLSDLYLARLRNASSVERVGDAELRAGIIVRGDEKGFRFRANGDINFEIGPRFRISQSDIFIGSQGFNPQDREFTLSQSAAQGLRPHTPGIEFGLFIGYNQEQDLWEVFASREAFLGLNIVVRADETITALSAVGFQNSNGELSDRLLVNSGESFQDATASAGLTAATSCGSVAAADFDNDMDTDLYLVCRGPVVNRPNVLYENLGAGQFEAVPQAGGAEGSDVGRGDSVAIADYDANGFVDLFVTNGNGDPPFDKGPQQLFRNLGNENGWLEIDLEGVISNRDGIGARLIASAGGIAQVREQSGGMHFASQNHQRVHFGLGKNRRVDQLTVHWPSGIVQKIDDIPANQLIRVTEPSVP